jgi:hypothetical protein
MIKALTFGVLLQMGFAALELAWLLLDLRYSILTYISLPWAVISSSVVAYLAPKKGFALASSMILITPAIWAVSHFSFCRFGFALDLCGLNGAKQLYIAGIYIALIPVLIGAAVGDEFSIRKHNGSELK